MFKTRKCIAGLALALAMVVCMSGPVAGAFAVKVFSAQKTTGTSSAVQLQNTQNIFELSQGAAFAIQVFEAATNAAGDWTFTYSCSIDGTNFVTPSGASAIKANYVFNGGPGTDGHDLYAFSPEPCAWLKIIATRNSGTIAGGIDVWLIVW